MIFEQGCYKEDVFISGSGYKKGGLFQGGGYY